MMSSCFLTIRRPSQCILIIDSIVENDKTSVSSTSASKPQLRVELMRKDWYSLSISCNGGGNKINLCLKIQNVHVAVRNLLLLPQSKTIKNFVGKVVVDMTGSFQI